MPAPAPPSVFSWPIVLNVGVTALPLVAAWGARRLTWTDPVGQVGWAWGAMFVCSIVQIAGVIEKRAFVMRAGSVAVGVLLPLLLVPALLTWIGPRAKRWQTAILGVTLAAAVATLLTLGSGREFSIIYKTPMHLGLLALTTAMLASQGRRASDPRSDSAEPGWLWIGGGHVVYLFATVIGRPLAEVLVPRSWSAVVDVHMALMLVYSATMVAIAWGIWLGRTVRSTTSQARIIPTPG